MSKSAAILASLIALLLSGLPALADDAVHVLSFYHQPPEIGDWIVVERRACPASTECIDDFLANYTQSPEACFYAAESFNTMRPGSKARCVLIKEMPKLLKQGRP